MRCININHIWPLRRSNGSRKPWKRVLFSLEANNSVKCECLFNRSAAGTRFYAISPFAKKKKKIPTRVCSHCFSVLIVRKMTYSLEGLDYCTISKIFNSLPVRTTFFCLYNPNFALNSLKFHLPLIVYWQVYLAPSRCTVPTWQKSKITFSTCM